VAQLDDAERLAAVLSEASKQVALADAAMNAAAKASTRAAQDVEAARVALENAQRAAEHAEAECARAQGTLAARIQERDEAQRVVPDTAALRTQLAGVQEHNRKVDANARRDALAKELADQEAQALILTTGIDRVDAAKAQRLADAKFPVDGLSVTDTGVTWQGLPFEQASTAIRTRVSAAIGFALNPKLKILLVRNGNDLDGKNLQLLADIAKEHGGQVWIERIAGGNGLQTVVIEDGAVQGAAPPVVTATADEGEPVARETVQAAAPAPASAKDSPAAPSRGRRRAAAGLFEGGSEK
jgi:uncharacterized protein YecT (DUF1311 family)